MRELKKLVYSTLSVFKRGLYFILSLYLKCIGFIINFSEKVLRKFLQFISSIRLINRTYFMITKFIKYVFSLLPNRLVNSFVSILDKVILNLAVFSKFFKKRVLVGFGLPLATFFIVITFVQSATYSFTQSSWIGGADTTATSTHTSNQSNWNKYYSATGLEVNSTVSLPATSYAFTDDGATSTTPLVPASGGGFANGVFASTTVIGSGTSASVNLSVNSSVVTNNWDTVLKSLPGTFTNYKTVMIRDGASDDIYIMFLNNFYKYKISTNTHTALAAIPGSIGNGFNATRNGSDDYIYVTRGGATTDFYRYSISGNSWTTLTVAPGGINTGSQMIRNTSDDDIYVTQGGLNTGFYKYSISGNSWTILTVAPGSVGVGSKMIRNASDDYIYLTRGGTNTSFYRYSISGNSWTTLTVAPGNIGIGGNMIRNSSDDDIYVLAGGSVSSFYKYSISGNSWTTLTNSATWTGDESAFIRNGSEDYIYLMRYTGGSSFLVRYSISGNSWSNMTNIPESVGTGVFMLRNGSDNEIYAVAGWFGNRGFYKYSISGNSWTGSNVSRLTVLPSTMGRGSSMIRNGSDNDIYVTQGDSGNGFYKYSVTNNSWTTLTSVPGTLGDGSHMIRNGSDDYIYLIGVGTRFYRYSISGNSWTTLAAAPGIGTGGTMTRNGSDDTIYLMVGGNATSFYKYSISSNSWTALTPVPGWVGNDSNMIRNGSEDYIYVKQMWSGTYAFYRYSISGNSWTTLTAIPGALGNGSHMIRNGDDDYIYITQGGSGTGFYRYSIAGNSWTTLAAMPAGNYDGSFMLRNGSDNEIYLTQGAGTGFYRYSISGNTWTTLVTTLGVINDASKMIRNGSDNEIYLTQGLGGTGFYKFIINLVTYDSSGNFTSSPIKLNEGANFSTLSFSTTLNAQTVTLKARSSATVDLSSSSAWGSCTTITSGGALSTGGCVTDGHQYIQYQATLSTSDTSVTPTLDSVGINYSQYNSEGILISSPYDTSSDANLISRISWTESATSTNQTIKFQVRSSLDGITWSNWCGSSNTCDGNDYFLYSNNGVSFDTNHPLRDGINDRYLQYKAILSSGGAVTPQLSQVNVQYVVNAPPEFDATHGTNGVTASQITDEQDINYGKVSISYRIRDPDGSTGTITPGYVTPSFEYNLGGGWVAIDQSALSIGDTNNKSADDNNYATYTAMWSATTTIAGAFSSTTQLRVSVNDNEAANNFGRAISAPFVLDTKSPTYSTIILDSSENNIIMSSSDDSQLQYRLCNDNTFPSTDTQGNSCGWSALSGNLSSSSIPWLPSKDIDGNETVYIQIKDIAGNYTYHTVVAPSLSANFDFKDISNVLINSYREFLSWAVFQATTSSSFSSYKLYHSTDGVNYSVLTDITNPAINYYHHTISTGTSSTHFYKLAVEDTDGDISDYTTVLSDVPNGQGSSDTTAPTIEPSSILVPVDNLKNTSVQVTFTTDELAKGEVEYRQNGSSTWIAVPSVSYVLSHSIYIQNLLPNTSYNLRLRAEDVSGNMSSYVSGPDFTTVGGPVITGVNAINLTDNSVTIFWNTSTSSDSYVYYSINQNIIPSISEWSATNVACITSICQHKIDITGLIPGTRYYYYVKSTDGDGNATIETNGGSYYTFSTTLDVNAPQISNISTPVISSNAGVIVWQTDEPSTSQVMWGTVSGALTRTTVIDNVMSNYHVVSLSKDTIDTNSQAQGLTASTPYYFKVFSTDPAGNTSSSSEQTFSTTKDGEVVIVTQYVGGGGGSPSVTLDTTAPVITSVDVGNVGAFSTEVKVVTNEEVRVFIDYGETKEYGDTVASSDWNTSKIIKLKRLKTGTDYYYRVKVSDKFGNDTIYPDSTFKTLFISEMLADSTFLDKATDIQGKIEELIESALPSLSPPSVSTPSVVDITESGATVIWKTNIKSISSLDYSTDEDYKANKETYTLNAPSSAEKQLTHTIELSNLKPNTKYHIQAKSFVFPQVVGKSQDLTFITKAPNIQGSIVDRKTDSFRAVWTSNNLSSSIVDYKNVRTGESNRKVIKESVKYHDVEVTGLTPGTTYEVAISGLTANGNTIEAREPFIVTMGIDNTPPQVASIKVNSALVSGRTDRAQTVISWNTDEPATSIVSYEEGSGSSDKELSNKIEETNNYTTNHAVIVPVLKPGTIYRIQVSSKDEAGNLRKLPMRTIITPQHNESVVDVIFKNFEDTFKVFKQVR